MKIEDWFESKDYGLGLALLGKHSKNKMLLQNLTRKCWPEKLEYELRKVAYSQNAEIITLPATEPKPESHSDTVIDQMNTEQSSKLKIIRNKRTIEYDELPAEMQARWNQNHDAYKEIRSLHEKLKLMDNASVEDRAVNTARISDLDDILRKNWEVIDAWTPEPEKTEPVKAIDHKRIGANRKYISTNIKKLQVLKDLVKVAKIKTELQERYNELKTAGEEVASETVEELTKAGIQC